MTTAGRLGEFERDARSRIEVEQVRVGQLLALMDRHGAARASGSADPRGRLMRVLAVAQIADLVERQCDGGRVGRAAA